MMEAKKFNKESIFWVDLTRVIASFFVVVIHVIENIVNEWGQYPPNIQNIANVYDSTTRMSVPLFFMVSGWLLLPKKEKVRDFFLKRFIKVFIPFFVWSGVYLVFVCGVTLTGCDTVWVSRLLFLHGAYPHLWFFYFLLGIYLVMPILRLLIVPDKQALLWYLVLLWLFFEPILSLANTYLDFKTNIPVPLATGFVGFVILGYLLGELKISRNLFYFAAVIWVLSAIFTCISTYTLNRGAESFDYFFYWYLSLNVIVNSASGFIAIRWLADRSWLLVGWIRSTIRVFSAASFGIYFVHPLVLIWLGEKNPFIHINTDIGNPIWSIPFVSILTFFLSFAGIYLMQKIPVLKRIVP